MPQVTALVVLLVAAGADREPADRTAFDTSEAAERAGYRAGRIATGEGVQVAVKPANGNPRLPPSSCRRRDVVTGPRDPVNRTMFATIDVVDRSVERADEHWHE